MKILIGYPPLNSSKGTPLLSQNRQFQWFHNPSFIYPMVMASAATVLKQLGHEIIWIDGIAERKTKEDFLSLYESVRPELFVFESKTPVIKQHWQLINGLKIISPSTKLVIVGDHVTALPKETLEESKVDYVITGGNYDFTLPDLVNSIQTGKVMPENIYFRKDTKQVKGNRKEGKIDLNTLPFIDRELTKWYLYGEKLYKRPPFTYIMAGRDCPYGRCTFCSWTTLYPKFSVRSPENVLDEIGFLVKSYNIREIFDDTGTFPSGSWLQTFCEGMIERNYNRKILFSCNFRFDYLTEQRAKLMKKAGFRLMKLGLESANQKTLDRLCKGTKAEDILKGCRIAKKAGLEVHLTIMVGYPWETKADALKTMNLARYLMNHGYADMLQSTVTIPYPGTPLYQEAVKNNWFLFDNRAYERFDMTEPVFKTSMAPEEVMDICDSIYKSFLNPAYFCRHLLRIRSWEDITYLARGIKPVFGHIRDFARTDSS